MRNAFSELVIGRAGGPVEFVGDFVLIVPLALIVGLGLPAAALWIEQGETDVR